MAIADLGVPRDATVVAVVREDRLVVPRGDTVLQVGDEVLVLVTADAEDEVQRAVRRRLIRPRHRVSLQCAESPTAAKMPRTRA